MENTEILETADLLEDTIIKTKDALSPLKEEIEYRRLEASFNEMNKLAEHLDAEYKDLLGMSPRFVQPQPTNAIVDGSVFLVHDEEHGTTYGLQLYGSYSPSENSLKNPGRLPELIVFDRNGARKTYELDERQYKDVQEKIHDVLIREEQQIKELSKKNGNEVDNVISNL